MAQKKVFDVAMYIQVEAEDENSAFADVRTNYCVVDDPAGAVKDNLVEFEIDSVTEAIPDEADADVLLEIANGGEQPLCAHT